MSTEFYRFTSPLASRCSDVHRIVTRGDDGRTRVYHVEIVEAESAHVDKLLASGAIVRLHLSDVWVALNPPTSTPEEPPAPAPQRARRHRHRRLSLVRD